MGGNALKELGVTRISSELYETYINEILTILDASLGYKKIFIPSSIKEKDSFGDLDILLCLEDETVDIRKYITETFSPRQIFANGNVFSWDYKNFQIDFIMCKEEDFDIYKNFILWGDASMVLGRVARLFDLKYGIYGLEFVMRDPDTQHVVNEINVSKDPRKCMEFLGYNYDRWQEGFKYEQELIDFVFSSRYISQEFLTAYSENTKHRKRDKHRDQYKRMYEWFINNKDRFPVDTIAPKDKELVVSLLDNYFPESNIRSKYNDAIKFITNERIAREKFNGDIIREYLSEYFDLSDDKVFGLFMKKFNDGFPDKKTKHNYIIFNSIDKLKFDVKNLALSELITVKKKNA